MKRNWRKGWVTLPIVAVISAGTIGLTAFAERSSTLHTAPLVTDSTSVRSTTPAPTGSVARLDELSDAFATVAARIKPSVVYITAKQAARPVAQRSRGQSQRGQAPNLDQLPPELRQFFRDMPGIGDMDGDPRPRGGGTASGSGFIVSKDGYILTNNHRVDRASEVRVRLLDRREYKARVIGRDPNTDVAVIKIDAKDLT